MSQIFNAPSKAILRSQIAEHIAETDKSDKRENMEGELPLPPDRFFDRELSWLKFNKRVLELAQDETIPIIERASFAAIFASNLDEFFMVRVGSLYDQTLLKNNKTDNVTHMTAAEQIAAITPRVAELQAKCESAQISPKALDLRGLLAAVRLMDKGLSPLNSLRLGIGNKIFDPYERKLVDDLFIARIPSNADHDTVFSSK